MKKTNLPLFMNFYEKKDVWDNRQQLVVSSKILQTSQMEITLPFKKCSNFKKK